MNVSDIAKATKIVLKILKAKSASNDQIQLSFLQKFNGHILNCGHEVPLYVENELITVQIVQLEANEHVNFAFFNRFEGQLEVKR